MKMSNKYAYVTRVMHAVIINNKRKGFPCSKEAAKLLLGEGSKANVWSVEIDNKIIWVSDREFKDNNLKEKPIPNSLME